MSKGRHGHAYSNGYPSWYIFVTDRHFAIIDPPSDEYEETLPGRDWKRIDRASLENLISRLQRAADDLEYLPEDHEWELADGAVRWDPDSNFFSHRQQPPLRFDMQVGPEWESYNRAKKIREKA